jgi:putative ABC transport system permease protein
MLSKVKNVAHVKDVYANTIVGAKGKVGNNSMDVSFYGTSSGYLSKSGTTLKNGQELSGNGNELLVNETYLSFLTQDKSQSANQEATFDIIVPKGLTDKGDNLVVPDQKYRVIGVMNEDSTPKVYTNLNNLRQLGVQNYSQFKVEVDSKDYVSAVRKQIENMGLKTQYVGDTVEQINQVFNVFRGILSAFGLVVLFVAMLGMFNTLTISLLERIKEIALMKMLGMRRKDINRIFLTESMMLGLFGGVLGLLLGIISGKAANSILNHYAISRGAEAAVVFYSPTRFIIVIVLLSLIIGFLTGLYPARRAMKVKPLDVLRYE